MSNYTPDAKLLEIMATAYPAYSEMNPEQKAFVGAQCGMILYRLDEAGYKVVKK